VPHLTVAENAVQIGARHAVGQTENKLVRSVPVPRFVLTEISELCRGKDANELVFSDGKCLLRRSPRTICVTLQRVWP